MATKAYSAADVDWAEQKLREIIAEAPDDGTNPEIGTICQHGRGLTDYVECFAVSDGVIIRVTYWVALITGLRMTERGIPMDGGNYDKAHEVVDSLSRKLGIRLYRNRLLG